jgi:hypothetical protein
MNANMAANKLAQARIDAESEFMAIEKNLTGGCARLSLHA